MGTLTRNEYQFDASINIEDSNTYYDIASSIKGNLVSNLESASESLSSAQGIIDYDSANSQALGSRITTINETIENCNTLSSRIETGVQIYEEYDSSLKKLLDDYLINGLFNGKEVHFNEDGTVKEMDLDNLFTFFDGNQDGWYYGCNQNPFSHIKETDPEYYEYLRKAMKEQYGFTDEEIDYFMDRVDESATCTYARSVNDVIYAYKDRPDLFEETFGYPLYIENSNGKMVLNTTQLLADYIITSCTHCTSRKTFVEYKDGKYILNFDKSVGVFGDLQGWDDVNGFFDAKTKNSKVPLNYKIEELCNEESGLTPDQLKTLIEEKLRNGDCVSLGMCPRGKGAFSTGGADTVPFYDTESGAMYPMGGGHWITVTEVTDEGIIVDSWGMRCLIRNEDLVNDAFFNVYASQVKSGD